MTGNWPEALENRYPLSLASMERGLYHWLWLRAFLKKAETFFEIFSCAERGRMEADSGGKPELVFVGTGLLAWLSILKNDAQGAEDSLLSMENGRKRGAEILA